MYFSSRGFTLVELLVVIAIIGILAGIVLAGLSGTRLTSSDAGVKANLNTIRTQSYVYDNSNNGYGAGQAFQTVGLGSSCGSSGIWTDKIVSAASKEASMVGGVGTINGGNAVLACQSTANSWFIVGVLKSNTSLVWCVDSTGRSGTTTTASIVNTLTACP